MVVLKRTLLSAFLTLPVASAQNPEQMFPGLSLPDPIEWLRTTHTTITGMGVPDALTQIGWGVLFIGFVVNVSRLTYYGGSDLFPLFSRLILATAVLGSTVPIQTFAQNTWNTAYTYSSGLNDAQVQRFIDSAGELGKVVGPLVMVGGAGMLVKQATGSAIRAGTAGVRGLVGYEAGSATTKGFGLFVRLVMYAFLPVFGIYAALVYLSGLGVLFGMLIIPLVGASLIFPGQGAWLGRWIGMFLNSIFTILVLPVMMYIILSIGVLDPIEIMNDALQPVAAQWQAALAQITDPIQNLRESAGTAFDAGWKFLSGDISLAQFLTAGVYEAASEQLSALWGLATGWLTALVALFVGMAIALFMMRNFDKVIVGYVGGIAGGLMPHVPLGGSGSARPAPPSNSQTSSSTSPAAGNGGGGDSLVPSSGGGGSAPASAFVVNSGGGRSAMNGGGGKAVIDANYRSLDARGPRAALEDKG